MNILHKELKLSASPISFLFVFFGLMFFLPGYPILCGAFFVTLGIFKSFENTVETNDLVFSCLLPIGKKDIVKGKIMFSCLIELSSFILMGIAVIVRSTVLQNLQVYRNNALMNANGFALAGALIIFALFNLIFITGFFKTAYKRTGPFVWFIVAAFSTIGLCESLHFIPALSAVNAFGKDHLFIQLIMLGTGIVFFAVMTYIAYRKSCCDFEKIDM